MSLNTLQKQIFILHPHFMKYGGASKVVLELGSRLKKQGLDVKIITTKINPDVTKDYANLEFISLSNLHTGNLLFWILFPIFYFKLSKLLKEQEAKILFSHSLAIYWGAVFKFFNPKVININYFHDLGMPYFDNKDEMEGLPKFSKAILKIVSPIFRMLNKRVVKQSNFIISNSNFTASEIQKKYSRKTDLIVHPAVDYDIFKPTETKKDYIYTLGRLEKIKKIDLIIRSFHLYTKKYEDGILNLLVVGSGVEENNLKYLCKNLKIESRVIFKKSCSPTEVAKLAASAKIGLFFCKNETFGIAPVESMACGTPVLGINSGGIAETVINNKTGILVTANEDIIAEKIHYLLQNESLLKEYSQNAANLTRERFNWDHETEKLANFINSIK